MKNLCLICFICFFNISLVQSETVLVKAGNHFKLPPLCGSILLNPNSGSDIYKVTCKKEIPHSLAAFYQEENLTWKMFEVNDPQSFDQWSLDFLNIFSFWNSLVPTGFSPLVAIIDTGIDFNHEDLKNTIAVNRLEIKENNIDDDHNGYIDDYLGWNALDNHSLPLDDHQHGSGISGIINAQVNNSVGIAGLSPFPAIVPIKFLSPRGGNTDVAIKALDYAISRKVNIINLSWGGPKPSPLLEEMLKRCQNLGILVVIAAGNESNDNEKIPTYPANYTLANIISVASNDWRGELSSFSNFSKTRVHIAAPGESILSTTLNHRYGFLTGTSFAAPHIAAAAALVWSRHPDWTYLNVKNFLLNNCHQEASLKEKISCNGYLDFQLLISTEAKTSL